MKLDELLTAEARNQMREDRHLDYLRFATGFLRQTFPNDPALTSDEIRSELARQVHARGRILGLQRQREHLHLLVQSVYCGLAFDANPLFAPALRRAGWVDAGGRRAGQIDVEAFNTGMFGWTALADVECAEPDRINQACQIAYQEWQGVGPAGADHIRDALIASLADIWRDRVAASDAAAMRHFADLVAKQAQALGLSGGMILFYALLALHLGLFFMHDPRFGALAATITASPGQPPDAQFFTQVMAGLVPLAKEQAHG